MSIDTSAPRTRRAVIAGAFGALLGTIGATARPPIARAGTDGDVVLDATNTAAGTTVINGDGSNAVFRVANADDDAVQAVSANGVGLLGGSGATSFPSPIEPSTGVYGISADGHGVYGASDSNAGIYAANNASTVAAIVAEGDPGTAIHGHANAGPVPASPALTGVYGSAEGAGVGVHGAGTTGVGVRATATTGVALEVSGRAAFSRSGRASLPAGAKSVDVTVPGGLSSTANVLATLQIKRAKVHVLAARPNQPSAGKVRIYVSDVASTTEATPIAWFVLG